MSIKSFTSLVTGAISIPLFILLSHEGLQAQTNAECDRYARERAEREEGGVIRKGKDQPIINASSAAVTIDKVVGYCIANTEANLLETFNQSH